MRPVLITIVLAAVLSGAALWRADFSIDKIQIPLLATNDPPLLESFEWPRKFRYLNQGAQIFAFESEDQTMVLKFFKQGHLKIPLFSSKKNKARKREKIRIYPESYRLAFTYFPKQTALLALHQGVSEQLYPIVEVIDKTFRKYLIDLNTVPFVLQKKGMGTLMSPLLQDKSKLSSFFDQYLSFHAFRIGFGIADGDRDIKRNYAWIGEEFIYIDPARFFYEKELKKPERIRLEWWKAVHRVRRWVVKHAPEQVAAFDLKTEAYVNKSLHEISSQ